MEAVQTSYIASLPHILWQINLSVDTEQWIQIVHRHYFREKGTKGHPVENIQLDELLFPYHENSTA